MGHGDRFTACPTPPNAAGSSWGSCSSRAGARPTSRANLAAALPAAGWEATVLSGSLSLPGRPRRRARVLPRARRAHRRHDGRARGAGPAGADPPLHPSYEDRPGAPDRSSPALDDAAYEHQVDTGRARSRTRGAAEADVLHLHHLTPLNEAAARVAPDVPVVGHLHGTELLMLEAIELGDAGLAARRGVGERMRRWARRCERLIVLSDTQVARAERLLGVDPERCVQVCPTASTPRSSSRSRSTARRTGAATSSRSRTAGGRRGGRVRRLRARTCGLRRRPRCSTSGASPPSSASGC